MGVIIPAILCASRSEVEEELALVRGLVSTVQIDVVDGKYATPATWPYTEGGLDAFAPTWDIHELGDFRFEMDLMVHEPHDAVRAFLKAGAGKLIIHAESVRNVGALFDELKKTYGHDKEFNAELLSVALALRADTNIAPLHAYIEQCNYVQFMGIAHIGKQGQPFDERVLKAIREFRKAHPEVPVQVDGGVSRETAPRLLDAGADRLVIGSALWKSEDVRGELHAFEEIAEDYGRYR
jgi:ribulose-phosphate 3-epimerase